MYLCRHVGTFTLILVNSKVGRHPSPLRRHHLREGYDIPIGRITTSQEQRRSCKSKKKVELFGISE